MTSSNIPTAKQEVEVEENSNNNNDGDGGGVDDDTGITAAAAAAASSSSSAPDSQINPHTSLQYWQSISPDVNGMLGGYPHISRIDLRGSQSFLAKLRRLLLRSSNPSSAANKNNTSNNINTATATATEPPPPDATTASPSSTDTSSATRPTTTTTPATKKLSLCVDCGAGIGRVTEGFLSRVCETVDVVEPIDNFAKVLRDGALKRQGRVGDIYVSGLEDWTPSKPYDLIWNQWCLGHLTDAQLVAYLARCGKALSPDGGWIVVKENLSTDAFGDDIFDALDSSVTRSDRKFRSLFEQAGLQLVRAELQAGFPKGLYPVKMYALRPK